MISSSEVKHEIARIGTALKADALKTYFPAKSLSASDADVQRSWGPAMRR